MKSSLNQRHDLERALAQTRRQVEQLAGRMLLRPQCMTDAEQFQKARI